MKTDGLSLIWRIVLPIPIVVAAALAGTWFVVPAMVGENVRDSSVESAVRTANQFKAIRGYYTKNVISKVSRPVPSNPRSITRAIPIPFLYRRHSSTT